MDNDYEHIEIEWDERYPFIAHTKNYGRAEFVVCVGRSGNHLTDVWVTTKEQENARMFHADLRGRKRRGVWFSSYGCDDCKVWITDWCIGHKAPNMSLYVPRDAQTIAFNLALEYFCIEFRGAA